MATNHAANHAAKFDPGRIVATPGAIELWEKHSVDFTTLLRRHLSGDWGDMDGHDWAMNDRAVKSGEDRIFSQYTTPHGKVWIITEWDHSVTTILLSEEY